MPSLNAQDLRLAQFYKAPQLLNPAMTGVFSGQFRFHLNYRDQWSSILGNQPFRTQNVGTDFHLKAFGQDFFGIGLNAYLDGGSGDGEFKQTKVHLSGSYAKQVSGNAYSHQSQYLIAGAQVGFGQNTLNWNRLWFSDQFDGLAGYPAFDNPSEETWFNQSTGDTDLYLDVNLGLLWYMTLSQNSSIYFGGALNHLNGPNVSLENESETLEMRWVIHSGGEIALSNYLSFLPGLLIQNQGDRSSISFGTNFRYSNSDWKEMAFRIGIWPHLSKQRESNLFMDEWTTSLILEWTQWDIGISYGINTSPLKNATLSRGAFELSLTYVRQGKDKVKTKCPKL